MITLRFATKSLGSSCRTRTRLTTRLLSSSTESSSSSSSSAVVAKESSAMLEGTDTASLGTTIIRHGHGDRVITLNVGGKELPSTWAARKEDDADGSKSSLSSGAKPAPA